MKRSDIYTKEQWRTDGTFSAQPGQEITADVYDSMLNCVPPRSLPKETARRASQDHSVSIHAGFLMGEPHCSDKEGRQLYLAFGMSGNRYYYLGLSQAREV